MNDIDKLNDVYLNNIILEAYRRPIFGWSPKNFEKNIVKKLQKHIKGGLFKDNTYELFDGFFLSKNLFSFKDLFKSDPVIKPSGEGRNLLISLIYSQELSGKNAKNFLIGNEKDNWKNKGILWNPVFRNQLEGTIFTGGATGNDELGEDDTDNNVNSDDEELNESVESIYLNNIINEGLFGFGKGKKDNTPITVPFDEKSVKESVNLTVIFQFDAVQYCEKAKKKEQYNLNRLSGMSGSIFLKIDDVEFEVSNHLVWKQKRTENMDPPKPLKDQIKEAWNSGKRGESAGLLGLATKKLVGGIGNTFLGPNLTNIGANVVQAEDFDIEFDEDYSLKNMDSGEPDGQSVKRTGRSSTISATINDKLNDYIDNEKVKFDINVKNGQIECNIKFNNNKIMTIKFKLEGN